MVGNLTVVGQTSGGYLALTETATASPTTSTLNAPTGDIRANGAIVRLAPNGTAGLTWSGAAAREHTPSSMRPATSCRRRGCPRRARGTSRAMPRRGSWTADRTRLLGQAAARPAQDVHDPARRPRFESTAVAGNLTVVAGDGRRLRDHLAAAQAAPTTSTLNFPVGDTRANNVITKLSPSKTLSITYMGPAGTSVDAVFDVVGLFGPGQAGFVPLVPNRVVDSRTGLGLSSRLKARTVRRADIADLRPTDPSRNIPPDASTGSLLFKEGYTTNVTFIAPNAAGYLSVLPGGSRPHRPPPRSTRRRATSGRTGRSSPGPGSAPSTWSSGTRPRAAP